MQRLWTRAHAAGDAYPNANAHGHSGADAHADREPDRHASVHGHSGADIHADREPDADGNAYRDSDPYTYTFTYSHSNTTAIRDNDGYRHRMPVRVSHRLSMQEGGRLLSGERRSRCATTPDRAESFRGEQGDHRPDRGFHGDIVL